MDKAAQEEQVQAGHVCGTAAQFTGLREAPHEERRKSNRRYHFEQGYRYG